MLQMLLRIIKTEGFTGVFKGFSANMINTFSQRISISFYLVHAIPPLLIFLEFAYFFFHS
ncbi:MC/SLC25 family protein, partial [Massilia sp. CT11-108]|uniref:MC/SLC25 family protein n=1 Tax=Massilia sp. CT11-108 TaxID=3393900 RepID=UPI0039A6AE99